MTDATLTLNGKEYKVADLSDAQKKVLEEINVARSIGAQLDYQLAVMKQRYDTLVGALAKELEGGAEAEA